MKKLLVEYMPFKYNHSRIMESVTQNPGRFIVEGVLQRAEAKNQNGRVYPRQILEREVQRYKQVEIAENRALGELDHPDSNIVNLKNVSHNILDCYWNGDDLYGKVEILDTPSGNILKNLFKAGVTVGISSRGMGSVKQLDEVTVEVQPDFELVCWDFVSNPSTHNAFMKQVNESVQISNGSNNMAHELIRDIICELSGVCCIQ